MTERIGEVVAGRYRLEAVLGRGGGGVVYRARQIGVDREVALKLLRRHEDPAARARFAREARVAARLNHPAAVAIHELGEHEGQPFIAMELAVGTSLRALLGAALASEEAVTIAARIADVLVAAHALPLVHRDLKPENVIVASDQVRILDFGLAFLQAHETDDRMTAIGVVAGTPAYVSPEQARGGDVGPPTDIYALGCVLTEMLTGAPPFVGSDVEVLTRQLYAPPPPLRGDGAIPAGLEALVTEMLDKRASARPSAADVCEALASMDQSGRAREPERTRRARMVPSGRETTGRDPMHGEVAIVGEVDASLLLGLSAAGVWAYVVTSEQPLEAPGAILAIGATPDEVRALAAMAPVVADAESTDLARIGELIASGATEVVPLPLSSEAVASRLARALRKRRR